MPVREASSRVEIGDAMGQALLTLIPLALAAALSSVPITATIFILLSESRGRSGLSFLAGTVIGTFATVALAAVAGHALPGRPREHEALVGKLEVVIGSALVLLGVVTLARRSRAGSGRGPRWLDSLGTVGILPVFGIGLALNLRPKAILLAAAAGLAIVGVDLGFYDNLGLVVIYTAMATCTVSVPIVATILFPRRMEPRLLSAKGWIAAHSSTVGATMMILIGAFVIGVGVTG
ncbi:hypothetical protein E0H73_00505 [Kribbella pittospori]|uniref:GAP family protein n=1 Tax=Kribbella pittospori TaxID=722689 RepID=A0A4R0L072_9ACTN|nr:GAP family protein [Kribbella pittospori]TCC65464.1 hypothetical protein E0H73_00505 [Kribbella pittospori]